MNEQDLKHLDLGFHRRHAVYLLVLALVSVLFSLIAPGSAKADTSGCAGRVTDYAVTDGYVDKIVLRPHDDRPVGPGGIVEVYDNGMLRVTGTPIYQRCITRSDGHGHIIPGTPLLKVKSIDWCWTWMVGEDHYWFQGVRVQGRMYDASGVNVQPGEIKIPDKKAVQNCITQDVPVSAEAWQEQRDLPLFRYNFMVTQRSPAADYQGLRGAVRMNPHKDIMVAGPHW